MSRLLLTLALLLLAAPQAQAAAEPPAAPLHVVASFSILADIAQNVGGDAVAVETLVPRDADAHDYQPTPADVQKLAKADILILNGLGLEGWMDRLTKASGFKGKIVIASAHVTPRKESAHDIDPHAWQDLKNGKLYAQEIAAAFIAAAPQQAPRIASRAKAYESEIDKLDVWTQAQFASLPAASKNIITTHDAFGYFGAAYGITFLAPMGLSTEAEPSAKDIARLSTQIKKLHIKKLFIENMTSPRLLDQIAKDTGATLGDALFSDALSKEDGPAPTYLDMFRHNVPLLKESLTLIVS